MLARPPTILGEAAKAMDFRTLLGHVWAVLANLVALAIVLAAFSVARTPFETIVFAGLTLTYLAVEHTTATLGLLHANLAEGLSSSLTRIGKRLGDPRAEQEEQQLRAAREEVRAAFVRARINRVFRSILFFIALVVLAGAVLG